MNAARAGAGAGAGAARSAETIAVWHGFEGVLTPPAPQLLREFADRVHVPAYALSQAIAPALGVPADAGPDWAWAVERTLELEFGLECDLSGFREFWVALCRPSPTCRASISLLREQGVFVGLLTPGPLNRLPGWLHRERTELFDAVVVSSGGSGDLLSAELFDRAAGASGRPARRNVLVDADERRCAQARAAGWRSVLLRRAGQAAEELSWLLPRPSADRRAAVRRTE